MDMDDMDLERELRDAGVTDECMDDCMPSEMCMVMGMVEDGMRDMGVPEECMDVCMPDEDCMDCMMAVDWDNMEDPCEGLDLEGEDLLDCYMDANPCMEACPTAACDEC